MPSPSLRVVREKTSTHQDFLRKIKEAALKTVVQTLVKQKQASKDGKIPRGSLAKAVESLLASGVVISIRTLNRRVQRSLVPKPTNEVGNPTDISETSEDNKINGAITLAQPKAIMPRETNTVDEENENSHQASNDVLKLGDSGSETLEKDDTNASAMEKVGSPMGGTNKVGKQCKNSQQSMNEIFYWREATLQGVINDLVEDKMSRLSGSRASADRLSIDAKVGFLASIGITINKKTLYSRVSRQFKKSQQASSTALDSTGSSNKATAAKSVSSEASEVTMERNARSQKGRKHIQMSPRASSTTLDSPPKAKKPRVDPKIREDVKKRQECIHAIAVAYSAERAANKAAGTRCKQGFIQELIARKREEYGVEEEIPIETIRSRARRGIREPNCLRPKKPIVHPKTKEDAIKRNNCMYAITNVFSAEVEARKGAGETCKAGFLYELIAKKKAEFGVPEEITILESAIRTRMKNGNPVPIYIPSNKILPPVRDPKTSNR